MNESDEEREARFRAIQEENERLKKVQAQKDSMESIRREAERNEAERQEIIRLQKKESFGSGEKAILALVLVIVIGILLGA
jgi:cell division protein FtsL